MMPTASRGWCSMTRVEGQSAQPNHCRPTRQDSRRAFPAQTEGRDFHQREAGHFHRGRGHQGTGENSRHGSWGRIVTRRSQNFREDRGARRAERGCHRRRMPRRRLRIGVGVPVPRGDGQSEDADRIAGNATRDHPRLGWYATVAEIDRSAGGARYHLRRQERQRGQGAPHRFGGRGGAERGVAGNGGKIGSWRPVASRKGAPTIGARLQNLWPLRPIACRIARKQVLARTRGHYPAPVRAIDAMEEGLAVSLERGLEIEARILAKSPLRNNART